MENSEFAPSAQITLCDDPSPRNIAEFAVKILDSKKARDRKLLYVEDQTSIADWFVVCTGTSSTHIDSLAQEVEYRLSKYGIAPLHTEGGRGDSWILADYGAVILHVFSAQKRDFYKLEKLFKEGSEVDISHIITE